MVEKIGALADDAARTVAHRLDSGLAGLLDQLLCDLRPTAGEQVRSARVVAFLDAVEGIVEAADFRRIRPDLCRNAGEYRFNSDIVPYQGSHVPSSIPRFGDVPTRVERRTALSCGLLLRSQNRPGRGTPSYHPGKVVRRAGRHEATGRLRGNVPRSRFHRLVAVPHTHLWAQAQIYRARYAPCVGMSMTKLADRVDL